MKKTAKKVLLWLYSPDFINQRRIPYKEIDFLLPELSASGRRSLIGVLKQNNYVVFDGLRSDSRLSITAHGINALTDAFPALNNSYEDWQGDWEVLTFLQAPTGDAQFRYLRSVLINSGAGQLSRGVYLYPKSFPQEIKAMCSQLYRQSVLIVHVDRWSFGDHRSVIVPLFKLSDIAERLSGVSKSVQQLLRESDAEKETSDQQKKLILSEFEKMVEILEIEIGITSHYFPQVDSALSLVLSLQKLIKL